MKLAVDGVESAHIWLDVDGHRSVPIGFRAGVTGPIIETVFEGWEAELLGYRTLIPVDRDVMVDTTRVFPPSGTRRDELPLWIKSGGLQLDAWLPGRQVAWLRRADGGWLAAVVVEVRSGNGKSRLRMHLWLAPDDLNIPGEVRGMVRARHEELRPRQRLQAETGYPASRPEA